jgi:hypothetical protein
LLLCNFGICSVFLRSFFFGFFSQPPCMLEFSSQPFVESESIVYTL